MRIVGIFSVCMMLAPVATPAFAEDATAPAYVLIIRSDGTLTSGEITRDAAAAVIPHATRRSDPIIVIFSKGKVYMSDQPAAKMPDGSSMMDFLSSSFCSDTRHAGGCG